MKKLLGLLAVAPMAITACGSKDVKEVTIGVYMGPTGFGAAKLGEDDKVSLDVRSGANAFDADVAKCDFEVAALPIAEAWALHNNEHVENDCGLGIASIIASNMLQFMTPSGEDAITNVTQLDGAEILIPAPNTVQLIIKEMIEEVDWTTAGITAPTVSAMAPEAIIAALKAGDSTTIGILPEYAVSAQDAILVRGNNILDLTGSDFKTDRPIGVLAVNKDWAEDNNDTMTHIMEEYKKSVDYMTDANNLDAAADLSAKHGIVPETAAAIAKKSIPNAKIQWTVGSDMRDEVASMLADLLDATVTSELFYEVS